MKAGLFVRAHCALSFLNEGVTPENKKLNNRLYRRYIFVIVVRHGKFRQIFYTIYLCIKFHSNILKLTKFFLISKG